MHQPITAFHLDPESHWVAELACGHGQHVRHDPPWQNRPWVLTEAGRAGKLRALLDCRQCDTSASRDLPRAEPLRCASIDASRRPLRQRP